LPGRVKKTMKVLAQVKIQVETNKQIKREGGREEELTSTFLCITHISR
jgi:hypothetical protein